MKNEPLASAVRPVTLAEYIGQSHLVAEGKPLRVAIECGQLFSMVFWGPPGVGKTTLARLYAAAMGAEFVELSAVSAGKAEVRQVVEAAGENKDRPTILFLDEIHRFNKAQQDFLLPYVESGVITLIGATTENPSFEVIAPLLSRCRVFVLNPLTDDEMDSLIERVIALLNAKTETRADVDDEARQWLIAMANGDARQAINMIENTLALYKEVTVETLQRTLQSKHLRFDKKGEEHYNTISAFIKSMRASDVDAALYYLARMVDAGEDPRFIARRMVIFASEDIGMAQPTALVVANEVFRAVETIGYPECQINLAHGTVYLALAKKDRSSYEAYFRALDDVKRFGNLPIPMQLRNAPTRLMKELGYGQASGDQNGRLLPDALRKRRYYEA